VESPLNLGIENSRRFRGLPVFAGLMEMGRDGFIGEAGFLSVESGNVGGDSYILLRHADAQTLLPETVDSLPT
jgi:hypothetical protein